MDPRRERGRSGVVPVELTTFVGRREEIRAAHRKLSEANLVTLVGTGGVGKTRLAMRLVAAVRKTEPSCEVRWVRLAALPTATDPDALEREVARAVGVKDVTDEAVWEVMVDQLVERLGRVPAKQLGYLLVLDNCEHVIESAGALVHDLLASVGGLHVLATSREPLGCQGERLQLVPPLSSPSFDSSYPSAARSEAMELLIERANAVGYRIAEHNHIAATRLCQQLDGIPLAIELAAAGLRDHSIEEISAGLTKGASARFRLLSGGPRYGGNPIHHSLRAALDWSYELCTHDERELWARLSVFEDGWDREAAQAVCAGGAIGAEEVLELLGRLVDKSIVTADTSASRTRYRLLETLRQYAQLRGGVSEVPLRRRHRNYYLAVATKAADDWYSQREQGWMEWTRAELANLRSAVNWSIATPGEGAAGLELAIRLAQLHAQFFVLNLGETLEWLETGLPFAPDDEVGMEMRLAATALAGWTALCLGDGNKAKSLLEEARRESPDPHHPQLLFFEGVFAFLAEGRPAGVGILSSALGAFDAIGKRYHGDRFVVLLLKAMAASFYSGKEEALAATQQCLSEAGMSGSLWATSKSMWVRGLALAWHGDPSQAVPMEREAMRRQREMDDRWGLIWSTHALAWALAEVLRSGDTGSACEPIEGSYIAFLLGGAQSLRDRTRAAISGLPAFAAANNKAMAIVREALGADAFMSAFEDGTKLLDDEIVLLALEGASALKGGEKTPTPVSRTLWDDLTDTEKEIATLVARGLTNTQIARHRISSVRTVEKHLEHIRQKLMADSRADIARWVVFDPSD